MIPLTPAGAYIRLGLAAAILGAVGYSYRWTYLHGLEVAQGRAAEAQVGELQSAITGMVTEINARQGKADASTQALQELDAQIDRFGGQLRRLAGGCVLAPERMRVLNEATAAANATGFSGAVPNPAAAPKR